MNEYLLFGFVKKTPERGRLEILSHNICTTIDIPDKSGSYTLEEATNILNSAGVSTKVVQDFYEANSNSSLCIFFALASWIKDYRQFIKSRNIKIISPGYYFDFVDFLNKESENKIWRTSKAQTNLLAKINFVGGLNSIFASKAACVKFGDKYKFVRKVASISRKS